MPDVLLQGRRQRSGSRQEEFGFGQAADHVPGCPHKNPLALPHGQVEAADHTKDDFGGTEAQGPPHGICEGAIPWAEKFRIDPSVDDVEPARVDPAGRAMVAFRNGRGGIPVAPGQNLGDKT
jgi:hypothetical protein